MRSILRSLAAVFCAFALLGCGRIVLPELTVAGTWEATYVWSGAYAGTGTFTLEMEGDGTFTSYGDSNDLDGVYEGTWTLVGNSITWTYDYEYDTAYTGTVSADFRSMSGTMSFRSSSYSNTGTWSAVKLDEQPAP